jgi:type I restriction enzyme S subunit
VQRNLKRYRASVLKAAVEGRLVPTEAELARAEGRDYEPASALLERILAERRRRWEEAELAKMKAKGKPPKDDKWKAKYKEPAEPDSSNLPDLPEGWCWASCAQILLRLQTGPFGSSLHKSDYVTGGTPIINPQHLQGYGIRPSERVAVAPDTVARLSAFRLEAGDIVLGRRGEMGRCALVEIREDGWLLGTGSLALKPVEAVDGRFFAWVLRSPRTVRTLEGESVGTTMTNLNQEILYGLPVPLPPTVEQVRIVQEIERHFSVIESLERSGVTQQAKCGRVRQAILKWAFEGKLVDQDVADEPATVLLKRIKAEREAAAGKKPTARVQRKTRSPKP